MGRHCTLVRVFLSDPGSERKRGRIGAWGWRNDPELKFANLMSSFGVGPGSLSSDKRTPFPKFRYVPIDWTMMLVLQIAGSAAISIRGFGAQGFAAVQLLMKFNSDRTNLTRNSHVQLARVSPSLLSQSSFQFAIGFAAKSDCS